MSQTFRALSLKSLQTTSNAQHTLCFSRSSLSQRVSLTIQFKYSLKVTKTKEGFCLNCKLDSSLDEIPKSDPLRIKSFHSVLKPLRDVEIFQTVQIMFGFLQKHHNSQLQNETSATAVSVDKRTPSYCANDTYWSKSGKRRQLGSRIRPVRVLV